ncbi:hypothetical protein LWI29_026321 [Acer saccharum]|uniref:Uncharacterized protein n=1 Tax=Acer saccharum TaxID=4024 RepID=A0AA39VX09_ACESA|nr:hypothetical protein LWI29_026321 [Acer saccharum]
MVKARGGDRDREVIIGVTADYRTRLDPPITSNYFGNCVVTQRRRQRQTSDYGIHGGLQDPSGASDAVQLFRNLCGDTDLHLLIMASCGSLDRTERKEKKTKVAAAEGDEDEAGAAEGDKDEGGRRLR